MDDEIYVKFFLFCQGLISERFKESWFGGHADKKDLIQETALHFMERDIDVSDPPSLAGLIVTVAKGKMRDWLRREGRKKPLGDAEEDIRSHWRSLSSVMNAREQFRLFANTLTPKERTVFKFAAQHSLGGGTWYEFSRNPSPSVIAAMADHFGLSTAAAAKRLSRVRRKYYDFIQIMQEGGRVESYLDRMLAELRRRVPCDDYGWFPADECTRILEINAEKIIERCRRGSIDALHLDGRWWISPAEMRRWIDRGDLKPGGYEQAMGLLSEQHMQEFSEGRGVRRVAWEYCRGLSRATTITEAGDDEERICDCNYQSRLRQAILEDETYRPTQEDMLATDWVEYYEGGYNQDEHFGPYGE